MPSAHKSTPKTARHPEPGHRGVPEPPPTVSARWLLSAFALTLVLAALCGYAALGLLFYQGQWQLLFHPSRSLTATPATMGLPYQEIHFDVTDAGKPRLDAWWIPASPGARHATQTVLYLHDARGSLSDTIPALAQLHSLGLNVFAIDYQGFGRSTGRHPTERLANTDAAAAWTYLTDTRHLAARNLIVMGDGAGAVFAARLAATFAPAAAILQNPPSTARQIFNSDAARTHQLFEAASDPKQFYDLDSAPPSVVSAAISRFLDPLLPQSPSTIQPSTR
jgi:pimeloyl-ACP methyl ester carboxylesterase